MKQFLLLAALLPCYFAPICGQSIQLSYLGKQNIPTGTIVDDVEIGGLSGIAYDPYTDTFTAISDDSRSAGASRMWQLSLDYDDSTFSDVQIHAYVPLKTVSGALPPVADTEGIAGNLDGSYYVSQEGLASAASPNNMPWISLFDGSTGRQLSEVPLPDKFLPSDASGQAVALNDANQANGVRANLSLECLGLTASKKILFTTNEAALKQDYSGDYDGTFNQAQNSEIRIVRFSGSPTTTEEKVYRADQGTLFIFVRRFNTVPDILPVDDDGKMLVMERGLTDNNTDLGSYRIRLYEVDFNQASATNVAGFNSLTGASYSRLSKTLVWQSSSNMDNVEALCFGRDINGFRSLVLASDNNFSSSQTTQLHVLLTNIPAVPRRVINISVAGQGTVTAQPSVAWYPEGSEVALSAVAETHYTFGDWTGDTSGSSAQQTLTMDANKAVTARFLSPFQSWGTNYFTHEKVWETNWASNDLEGDGLSNLLEYALNLQPLQPSTEGMPIVGHNDSNLTLDYQKDTAKSDISYQVQASSNLIDWFPYDDALISTDGSIETRRASLRFNDSYQFLRLKISSLFEPN